MRQFDLLNRKEIKKLNEKLKEQFGSEFDFSKYLVYKTSRDRVYIVNKEFANIDPKNLKINNLGLYFLTIEKNGVRLSLDGSYLYEGKKNILKLNKKNFEEWMTGKDLQVKEKRGYSILSYKGNFLGSGYSTGEKILNYVPKERRVVFK
ncbi:MAG: hypothetical protein IH948_06240 [Bacteroidetes bacterium]|nr:hypothetical protein [Bacteroidota bacterium]